MFLTTTTEVSSYTAYKETEQTGTLHSPVAWLAGTPQSPEAQLTENSTGPADTQTDLESSAGAQHTFLNPSPVGSSGLPVHKAHLSTQLLGRGSSRAAAGWVTALGSHSSSSSSHVAQAHLMLGC